MSSETIDVDSIGKEAMPGIKELAAVPHKAVLYADGGFYNNEKAGGWGLHGYVYSASDLPTKGSGNPKAIPTAAGYVEEKEGAAMVKVVNYVDRFGGVSKAKSNNHTELLAAKEALEYALDKGLSHTKIYSDSEYVVKGINLNLDKWQSAGWRKRNGEEVSNLEDWKDIASLLTRFKEQQTEVELAWIKGHNGHAGNEMADQWAGKGNSIGLNGSDIKYSFEDKPDGYWKPKAKYNRIFCHAKWYFSSLADEANKSACGRHVYWTGEHGDDEDVAKPQADAANAVLYLKEQDPVLEKLRDHYIEQDKRQLGHLFIGALSNITNPTIYADILRFGASVFRKNKATMSISTNNKVPVVHHVTPTGLAHYNLDNIVSLTDKLDRYLAKDKSIAVTDITDLLYEATEKKGVVERKIRKEINSTTKCLDLTVNYNTGKVSVLREMDVVPVSRAKVRMIMGNDIIRRNALAALADSVERVVVITWRESDEVFRYATVIETTDDVGIWASVFGNFKMVK
jgi:ribonuclease HI